MKMYRTSLLSLAVLLLMTVCASAQYPQIPPDVQRTSDSLMKAANAHSDSMWQLAWPVIQQEAKQGKPYIPWASRVDELPQADIPAFPGAEGGGKYSFGGRGGKVYVVTNLNDDGAGSLRWACEQGGARIVVFNVAGIIRLKTPLIIRAPYITIAGQTAPGDGVCIAGESVWINTHDVIIRYMRFRRGETWVGRRDDAIGGNPIGNIIIDHVSATWGLDENMSMYRHMYNDSTGKIEDKFGTVNITIQNSIFGEALDTWNHAFGSTLGGENCTFMRNLWANNAGRNPSVGWNGVFNFANNVIFNWVHRSVDGGDYRAQFNIINNYFKPGPATPNNNVGHRILKPESGRSKLKYKVYGRAYVNGNVMEGFPAITKDNWNGGVQVEEQADAGEYAAFMKWHKPLPMAPITILSAEQAKTYVLANAGATLPRRDAVDARIVKQVATGKIEYNADVQLPETQFKHRRLPIDSYKQGIITDIAQVGGYPEYKGTPYKDSDNDGMPDAYEIKMGLNANNAADAGKLAKNGYSNIENFLNSVVDVKTVKPAVAAK
ncbi:pectate lyase family protein [Phnomibacter ginsenosidimutans]|uniref:Polysaccharide lyase n=1 Tax=Phnomibacter ginsenosidimutans TaxID=2676868 RepID=A0A6I6GME8_9BACT|nr:polysaccharide lyase [Phnomibacter ginsenosidimutans]QGW28858.1 polysaccharide lyase [Phnomibacter ginsenosidimutans]